MCACRPKKTSFFIEDILKDSKKTYNNLSNGPKETLVYKEPVAKLNKVNANDVETRFNVADVQTEVQRDLEMETMKVNLEQIRHTYPLYPTPLKAKPWPQYKVKGNYGLDTRHSFSFYSDPMLNTEQMLRTQISSNRFAPGPYSIRHYGFDRDSSGGERSLNQDDSSMYDFTPIPRNKMFHIKIKGLPASCCSPWWGLGGRRKGGQVRFSAVQTGALERRFGGSKYLSPDERRALAASLRLSDRQVKTWFQNRRAKWRRTVPDLADPGSPVSDELSDDDVQISEY